MTSLAHPQKNGEDNVINRTGKARGIKKKVIMDQSEHDILHWRPNDTEQISKNVKLIDQS